MTEGLIKLMFSIIGTLLVSIILFNMIFLPDGQKLLWNAIEPAVENQWDLSSMNSGKDRTEVYDDLFNDYKHIQFDR